MDSQGGIGEAWTTCGDEKDHGEKYGWTCRKTWGPREDDFLGITPIQWVFLRKLRLQRGMPKREHWAWAAFVKTTPFLSSPRPLLLVQFRHLVLIHTPAMEKMLNKHPIN